VWSVVILALKYGKSGWTTSDKRCLGGAVIGIAMWILFDDPVFGIIISLIVGFLGSFLTFESAWEDPSREDKLAWALFWTSCIFALFAIPEWTLEDASQPIAYFATDSIMIYLLFIRGVKFKKRGSY
jgi:hypothetical protein